LLPWGNNNKKSFLGSLSGKFRSFNSKKPQASSTNKLASETNFDKQSTQTLQALDNLSNKVPKLSVNDIMIIPEHSRPKLGSLENYSSRVFQKDFGNKLHSKIGDDSDVIPESMVDLDKLNQASPRNRLINDKKIDLQKQSFDFKPDVTLSSRSEVGLLFKMEKSNKMTHDLSANEAFEHKDRPKTPKKSTNTQHNFDELE